MNIKSKKILSEVSAGELLDKMSILEIKLKKIENKESQKEINKEFEVLKEVKASNIKMTEKLYDLYKDLKAVNINLWEVEDKIRICEKNKDFGKIFISLARSVYFNNDKRSVIKYEINKLLGSNIREVKKYSDY